MTYARDARALMAVILLIVGIAAGCRLEGPGPVEDSLEYRLVNESWSTFSEIFSPNRGYRLAFLPFNLVARESGRLSEMWRVVDDGVLEFTDSANRHFRYRWFESTRLFAHCREGFPKPFFVAPDTLTAAEVFNLARSDGVDVCSPTTILRISGGRVIWSDELRNYVEMMDLSDLNLTRQDLAAIRDVGTLETMLLSRSGLLDADLPYVGRLSSLTNLTLEGNPITDDGIAYLTGLPLVGLDLSSTMVTDYGLNHLGNIPTLRVLYLANTAVTLNGEAMLHRQLPNLTIRR